MNMIERKGASITHAFDLSSLTKITDGYTAGSILKVVFSQSI